MIPTAKTLGILFGLVTKDQTVKLISIKQCNQLTKQTRMSYHVTASLFLAMSFSLQLNHALQGGFIQPITFLLLLKTVFGQECDGDAKIGLAEAVYLLQKISGLR
jgi:hypothetical protein